MKAILVIDTNNCLDCPLGEYIDTHTIRCRDSGEYAPLKKGMHRFKRCRLRPIPSKRRTDTYDIEEDSYWSGWNECIDVILGETEW